MKRMTIPQFLKALRKKVKETGEAAVIEKRATTCGGFVYSIRFGPDCPIEFLAGSIGAWSLGGEMGLDHGDIDKIVDAADGCNYFACKRQPKLRAQLLRACGLKETKHD